MSIQLIDFPGEWLVFYYVVRVFVFLGMLFYAQKFTRELFRPVRGDYNFSVLYAMVGALVAIVAIFLVFPPIFVVKF